MIQGIEVPLDECELEVAVRVGSWRRIRALRDRLGAGHGERQPGGNIWDRNITGAIAELAVAKQLDRYWGGFSSDFGRAGDVAGLEIRATTHPDGHLVVYMADPVERPIVLVVVTPAGGRWAATARIAGYLPPFTGREPRFLPPPGKLRPNSPQQWWIPQAQLRPFDTLRLEEAV
jgi:hypothetical protein